jgi:two-component system phosphate regulon sensor histidine kinase PhoR
VRDTLLPLAHEENVELRFERPEGDRPVEGEWDELVQVFQNLVQNGIRYGRSGGEVAVRIDPMRGGRLAVHVADNGPGIAPHHIPRLTERFYRVDVADSRRKAGTGLGLAIVKHIVSRHRGEFKIASKLGEGSIFTVVLPAARDE